MEAIRDCNEFIHSSATVVTLFATDFIEVQQCKKEEIICLIFVGGNLFSRDLIIADQ